MERQPIQVLVIPYRQMAGLFQFAIFKRSDAHYWQFIAGGVDGQETPAQAATREAFEEAGIKAEKIMTLDSMCTMPAHIFPAWQLWPKETHVVKEFSFAIEVFQKKIILSDEHTEYKWCSHEQACAFLKWDSNKNALDELHQRLKVSLT